MIGIGDRLKYIRTNLLKKTQADVIKDLEETFSTTIQTLSRYESEDRTATLEFIFAFCDIYNVNANYLLFDSTPIFREEKGKKSKTDLILDLVELLKDNPHKINRTNELALILQPSQENYLHVLSLMVNNDRFRRAVLLLANAEE